MSSSIKEPLKERLRTHYDDLKLQLRTHYYTDFLFANRVFSADDKEAVDQMERTPIHQAKRLMDILLTKSESSVEIFFQHLKTAQDKQPHLYYVLFPEEKPSSKTENGGPGQRPEDTSPSSDGHGGVLRQV